MAMLKMIRRGTGRISHEEQGSHAVNTAGVTGDLISMISMIRAWGFLPMGL
jgi:hypothetical protein